MIHWLGEKVTVVSGNSSNELIACEGWWAWSLYFCVSKQKFTLLC